MREEWREGWTDGKDGQMGGGGMDGWEGGKDGREGCDDNYEVGA